MGHSFSTGHSMLSKIGVTLFKVKPIFESMGVQLRKNAPYILYINIIIY